MLLSDQFSGKRSCSRDGFVVGPRSNQPCREIVRQQWNFSPSGATVEIEDHRVDLPTVAVLELVIDPGSEGQAVFASMESMQVA